MRYTATKVIVLSLLSCFPIGQTAQAFMRHPPPMDFSGSFEFGLHSIDLSGVNRELSKNGAGAFDDVTRTIGGSGYFRLGKRMLIGGEGAAFWQSATGPDAMAKIQGGYGFLNLGVVPVATRSLIIYPLIGIGGGGAKLRVHSRDYYDFYFGEEILPEWEEPGFGAFALNFSVGADYRLKLMETRRTVGGICLNMRTGYIWLPFESNWQASGFDIFGSPTATFAGTYAKLGIGIWSSKRTRSRRR